MLLPAPIRRGPSNSRRSRCARIAGRCRGRGSRPLSPAASASLAQASRRRLSPARSSLREFAQVRRQLAPLLGPMLSANEAPPLRCQRFGRQHPGGRLGPFRSSAVARDVDQENGRAGGLELADSFFEADRQATIGEGDDLVLAAVVARLVGRDCKLSNGASAKLRIPLRLKDTDSDDAELGPARVHSSRAERVSARGQGNVSGERLRRAGTVLTCVIAQLRA